MVEALNQVAVLVFKHSGVQITESESYEVAMPKVAATMEFLAAVADAGNAAVVGLVSGDVDEVVMQYIKDTGRAVQVRVAAMGVRPMSPGPSRFEVG